MWIILFENPPHTLNPRVDADKDLSNFWGFLLFQSALAAPPTCPLSLDNVNIDDNSIGGDSWGMMALAVQCATILSRPLQQLYQWPVDHWSCPGMAGLLTFCKLIIVLVWDGIIAPWAPNHLKGIKLTDLTGYLMSNPLEPAAQQDIWCTDIPAPTIFMSCSSHSTTCQTCTDTGGDRLNRLGSSLSTTIVRRCIPYLYTSHLTRNSRYLSGQWNIQKHNSTNKSTTIWGWTNLIFKPSQRQHWRKQTQLRGGSCMEYAQQVDGWQRKASKVRIPLAQFVHGTYDHVIVRFIPRAMRANERQIPFLQPTCEWWQERHCPCQEQSNEWWQVWRWIVGEWVNGQQDAGGDNNKVSTHISHLIHNIPTLVAFLRSCLGSTEQFPLAHKCKTLKFRACRWSSSFAASHLFSHPYGTLSSSYVSTNYGHQMFSRTHWWWSNMLGWWGMAR